MLFASPDQFHDAPRHAVTVFGMAGVGKTRLAALLRKSQWFHYSVDYRIGTRHMGEFITDNFKLEAMKQPFLRELLRTDSIKISSAITFANLDPLSTYLGRPAIRQRRVAARRVCRGRSSTAREIAARGGRASSRAHDLMATTLIADTGGSLEVSIR